MKWTVESATATIKRNGGTIAGKQIRIRNAGLKVLGAIDFLINKHKYARA